MMPELDGFGVLQTLRNNPQTAITPFILLTALVASCDRHGMEEGADDYITKPYNPDTLVGSVRRRLEKRNRQIEESRLRAEEVSLAVAASVPHEILDTLGHIMTVTNLMAVKYAGEDSQIAAMQQSVAQEAVRLRRMIWLPRVSWQGNARSPGHFLRRRLAPRVRGFGTPWCGWAGGSAADRDQDRGEKLLTHTGPFGFLSLR